MIPHRHNFIMKLLMYGERPSLEVYQFIMTNDAFVCRIVERHRSKFARMNMNDDVFMKFP